MNRGDPAQQSSGDRFGAVKMPLLEQLMNGHPKWTLAQRKQIVLKR